MKLNRKIIIPAFALLAGSALAGSVASTVAWYQYSTRTNVSYIGSSAGTVGNLQIKIAGAAGEAGQWGTRLSIQNVSDFLAAQHIGEAVEPVTPGAIDKDGSLKNLAWDAGVVVPHDEDEPDQQTDKDQLYLQLKDAVQDPEPAPAIQKLWKYSEEDEEWQEEAGIALLNLEQDADLPDANGSGPDVQVIDLRDNKLHSKQVGAAKNFYLNPSFGYGSYSNWLKAQSKHYVRIPLELRFIGEDEDDLQAKDVYLTKLLIQEDRNNGDDHGDISNAIRVHFSAYQEGDELHASNHLVSKNGGTTATHGKLKLGRGDDFDKAYAEGDEFGFNGTAYDYVEYGAGSQNSYGAFDEEQEGIFYEEDESLVDEDGWEELAVLGHGEAAPQLNAGHEGNFYIKEVDLDDQVDGNEGRELYIKEAGEWEEDAAVQKGTGNPNENANLDKDEYYLKTNDNELYAFNDHDDEDPSNDAWELVANVLVEDNDNAVAENYEIGQLRVNSEDNKLYTRIPGEWTLIASHLLDDDPELSEKGDFVIDDYYINPEDNKLYQYNGGVYKETISPILVKDDGVNANNPLEIEEEAEKVIGQTAESEDKVLHVDVTIWVEGWQKFNYNNKLTSMWDQELIGAMFDVGMQFAVQDLRAE